MGSHKLLNSLPSTNVDLVSWPPVQFWWHELAFIPCSVQFLRLNSITWFSVVPGSKLFKRRTQTTIHDPYRNTNHESELVDTLKVQVSIISHHFPLRLLTQDAHGPTWSNRMPFPSDLGLSLETLLLCIQLPDLAGDMPKASWLDLARDVSKISGCLASWSLNILEYPNLLCHSNLAVSLLPNASQCNSRMN